VVFLGGFFGFFWVGFLLPTLHGGGDGGLDPPPAAGGGGLRGSRIKAQRFGTTFTIKYL
jgi:hypothetical protein